MKIYLISLVTLLSLSTFGSTVDYCLDLKLENTSYDSIVSSARCEVSQKLTWDDFSVFFKCEFEDGVNFIFDSASKIGSDLGYKSWVFYEMSNSKVGKFLANGLKLNNIIKSQSIKIIFTNVVSPSSDFIIVEDTYSIYKLYLKTSIGSCYF